MNILMDQISATFFWFFYFTGACGPEGTVSL